MNITGSNHPFAIFPCCLIARNFNEEGKNECGLMYPVVAILASLYRLACAELQAHWIVEGKRGKTIKNINQMFPQKIYAMHV